MSEENKDEEKVENQSGIKLSEEFVKDLEKIQQQYSALLQPSFIIPDTIRDFFANHAVKTFPNPTQHLSVGLNSAALASIRSLSSSLTNQIRPLSLTISPLVEYSRSLQSAITPLIEYAEKNKDNLENFRKSSDKLIDRLIEQHEISEDEAIELFDEFIEDGKIIVQEDWTVELIEYTTEDTVKSQPSLSEIMIFFNIIVKLIAILVGTDIDIDIDNSTTYIENQIIGDVHYDDSVIETENEYIVVNDVELYEHDDVDSNVIRTLNSGDKVRRIIADDDSERMLVAIINQENELTDTGWIKIDDVTLID